MRYGAIYIAHNPRDGATIFKVGKTERAVNERMKELTASTSTLGTYTARAFFVVSDIDVAEAVCHKRLARYRVQNNREFFDLPFSRLFQMVQEEIAPYAARDFVPELPAEDSLPKAPSRTAVRNVTNGSPTKRNRRQSLGHSSGEGEKHSASMARDSPGDGTASSGRASRSRYFGMERYQAPLRLTGIYCSGLFLVLLLSDGVI